MRKLFSSAFVFAVLTITACNSTKSLHKIVGDQRVDTGIESKKYLDNGKKYYAIVVGEHGDEMEARLIATNEASLVFTAKNQAITDAVMKVVSESDMTNRSGERKLNSVRSVSNTAIVNNMVLEEDALFMNRDNGTYKYRAVFSVDIDEIIKNTLQ